MAHYLTEIEQTASHMPELRAKVEQLQTAIEDALRFLADTDLNAEERAANAQDCLARALT